VLVDDGHGEEDLLHLIVEIKGYRREDAQREKGYHGDLLAARSK
jgi:type III restriction enzyme